ncbi:helix-turn-helix domain-containing protein [Natrinema gelatinilyticum]|uniref:helix-turn-helix domain-containing protein n=1 Tax=Natrinema gelatinilyticum TaxID=2961571 RepID=UPI0020C3E549|nr:helix-turn-helix domain-containing protein [Natrinema gelatinilyticum]
MISISLDMVQYDCPYIEASDRYDVRLKGVHWEFDRTTKELETRIMVSAEDREELDRTLTMLSDHDAMDRYSLLARRGDQALIRNKIEETSAMRTLRDYDGYLTGPFEAQNGSEQWHVGFDRERIADDALSDLSRDNDFSVESRNTLSFADYFDVINNVNTAKDVLDAVRGLTDTEAKTIRRAMEAGHYETPRDATVTDLAAEFDVSTTALSKNVRRGERKLLTALVGAMDDVES